MALCWHERWWPVICYQAQRTPTSCHLLLSGPEIQRPDCVGLRHRGPGLSPFFPSPRPDHAGAVTARRKHWVRARPLKVIGCERGSVFLAASPRASPSLLPAVESCARHTEDPGFPWICTFEKERLWPGYLFMTPSSFSSCLDGGWRKAPCTLSLALSNPVEQRTAWAGP